MNKKPLLAFALITAVSLGTAFAQTGQPASRPTHSYILAMAESGGSIYLAGHYNDGYKDTACYWKDGRKTDLPAPAGTTGSYAMAVSVIGGAVYTAGFYENGERNTACYWRNGARTDLE